MKVSKNKGGYTIIDLNNVKYDLDVGHKYEGIYQKLSLSKGKEIRFINAFINYNETYYYADVSICSAVRQNDNEFRLWCSFVESDGTQRILVAIITSQDLLTFTEI